MRHRSYSVPGTQTRPNLIYMCMWLTQSETILSWFIMSVVPRPSRKPRKDGLYSREEKIILNRYKEEYRRLTTRELRGNLIRTFVLQDIFNYWTAQGMAPTTEEENISRMKVRWHTLLQQRGD